MKPLLVLLAVLFFSTLPFTANAEQLFALPLATNSTPASGQKLLDRYGVPFIEGTLPFKPDGSARVDIGQRVRRIFLFGMTDTASAHGWANPTNDYSNRYFIGDRMGEIRLDYADGSSQVFPLVYGESFWWGKIFNNYPEPFLSDARARRALQKSLRLYPAAPVKDGNYVAVIVPKDSTIKDIVAENSKSKLGFPVINGITVELADGEKMPNGIALTNEIHLSPEFKKFATEKPLCPPGVDTKKIQARLKTLKQAFYLNDRNLKGNVAVQSPPGYSGPTVSFQGSIYAQILANVFYANVQDMACKLDEDGMYHTSTKGAPNWGIYNGFGSYRTNVGLYYPVAWSRDMGRSLQELTELGYTNEAFRCADYCLRTARLWEDPTNAFQGHVLPPHWGRVANRPRNAPPFENDGQGLISIFLYKLWQRLPDRAAWLNTRWPDIKAAGDWILWQFDHPGISGATNGVLHTTGESAAMNGYSVYPDYACMEALLALARMADSIHQTNSAAQWRERAEKMRRAITENYLMTDPKYGHVWTLTDAGWPHKSTVLGPVILLADYRGFAPDDGDSDWRSITEAAYQRLIDTYRPFGFYGQTMGYGQGFVTQSALLLDRMKDATQMLDWLARESYDPRLNSFIVPEACDVDSTGHYWYWIGDLGNGVQEAENIKALRLVIGVDDTQPNRLRFYPRMPYDWNKITVDKFPVLFETAGKTETTFLRYQLERTRKGMLLKIVADKALGPVAMRLGPFEKQVDASNIQVNGRIPTGVSVEHSGDSWWAKFTTPIEKSM